jgi:Tfp pilus assembly protein PilO
MALLDSARSKSIVTILIVALLGYMIYTGEGLTTFGLQGLKAKQDRVKVLQDSITALTAQTDSLKKDLAKGSIEDVKKQTEAYRSTLDALRQLVPDQNEVPGLIDAISTRAKIRGVHLAAIGPQPVEVGPSPFDTHRYKMSVIGHYDQIGEFLTDMAGLKRVIVPTDVSMSIANAAAARALGDTTKSMLEARFFVKTYVKSTSVEGGPRAN